MATIGTLENLSSILILSFSEATFENAGTSAFRANSQSTFPLNFQPGLLIDLLPDLLIP